MGEKTDFIKIRVFLPMDYPKYMLFRNADASITPNPDYIEIFYDADAEFREPIMTFINEEVGLFNWAIKFIQQDDTRKKFDSFVYAANNEDYIKICVIIQNKIKHIDFVFWYRGTVNDYIENRVLPF